MKRHRRTRENSIGYTKRHWPTFSFPILLFSFVALSQIIANEPPEIVSIKDKVRMSTLIVVGNVVSSGIYNLKTLESIRGRNQVRAGEKALYVIDIQQVLYFSPREAPFFSNAPAGSIVEAVFGSPGLDIGGPEEKTSKVFFLTSDADRTDGTRPYRYPFYDWTNLSVPVSDEAEVKRIISVFEAIK